jgi:hypothetical protein
MRANDCSTSLFLVKLKGRKVRIVNLASIVFTFIFIFIIANICMRGVVLCVVRCVVVCGVVWCVVALYDDVIF